jgi:YD repeat-containing protein
VGGGIYQESKVVDPNGVATTYLYDGSGRVTDILNPDGSNAAFTYVSNQLTKIVEPGSRTVTVTINCARPNSGRIFCQIKGVSILGC